MSTEIPGQRTYELSFTALVTDSKIWDELRKDLEFGGVAEGQEIQLVSHDKGKFGRILGELFVGASAYSINQMMIENGHGYPYDGGTKQHKVFILHQNE